MRTVCEPEVFDQVVAELAAIEGVRQVLTSGLGEGARVVES